jgi:predicted GNAT superfamily acetyltransferase
MVRERLADALEGGYATGLGAWNDDDILVGVAAWAPMPDEPSAWYSQVLAVRFGHMRRGVGKALKVAMIERARAARIDLIISRIHQDNDAIRSLNEGLGARTTRPKGDRDHLLCTLPVLR